MTELGKAIAPPATAAAPIAPIAPLAPRAQATAPDSAAIARRQILTAAWLAIAIAVGIELILVLLRQRATFAAAIADFASKVTWSVVVCAALAVARAVRRDVMGFVGLLASPIAIGLARVAHKAANQALGLQATAAAPAWSILAVRALEYCVLGFVVERLLRRGFGVKRFAGAGLAVGAVFGAAVVGMQAPADALAAVSQSVNEILFPVGCSMTLYAADRISRRA